MFIEQKGVLQIGLGKTVDKYGRKIRAIPNRLKYLSHELTLYIGGKC